MRARVVDTSVLIAAVSEQDVHHEEARLMLSEAGPIVVPNEALTETMGVVAHRGSRQMASAYFARLVAESWVELGHPTPTQEALQIMHQHPKLSFVDACGVALAWQLGASLDSLDENQLAVWRRGPS